MARALIVGCGCRGRNLGLRLVAGGWLVRGTSRRQAGLEEIAAAGLEAAEADPADPCSVLEAATGVAVIVWLLGSALPGGCTRRPAEAHGEALEALLERLVDAPLRGFVYEAEGSTPAALRSRGESVVRTAASRWRMPVAVCRVGPGDPLAQVTALEAEIAALLGPAGSKTG